MKDNLIKRIGDNVLNTVYVDGQTYLHTDINELISVYKTAINENYYDIQRIQNGSIQVKDTLSIGGANLSKMANEVLQSSEEKIPTSLQVKTYIDLAISSLDARISALEKK